MGQAVTFQQYDDEDIGTVIAWIDTIRARKVHMCAECADLIEVGTWYRQERLMLDGSWLTQRFHPGCGCW